MVETLYWPNARTTQGEHLFTTTAALSPEEALEQFSIWEDGYGYTIEEAWITHGDAQHQERLYCGRIRGWEVKDRIIVKAEECGEYARTGDIMYRTEAGDIFVPNNVGFCDGSCYRSLRLDPDTMEPDGRNYTISFDWDEDERLYLVIDKE